MVSVTGDADDADDADDDDDDENDDDDEALKLPTAFDPPPPPLPPLSVRQEGHSSLGGNNSPSLALRRASERSCR